MGETGSKDEPLISVVIPAKNGAAWLDRTLRAILGQKIDAGFEIIAIDSGSTDNSLSILANHPVRVFAIPPDKFNHGLTRNYGLSLAKGKYVVMTVQDAEPANEYWLQELLAGFDDERVAAVCGQQVVPHDPNMNPVDWFRPLSAPARKKFYFDQPAQFESLSPEEKKSVCSWDNVNAMYRRDILCRLPFRAVNFAEDAWWAKDALMAGYSIVYNTAARVNHYHYESPDYSFRRAFFEYYQYFKLFGVKPVPARIQVMHLLRNVKILMQAEGINWENKWKWLLYNYQRRKAINHSAHLFLRTLGKGESALENAYQKISGSIPQAMKPAEG